MGYLLKTDWWKWLCVALLAYTIIGGLLLPVPELPILNETIRALHFHVPMWFGMILLFLGSVIHAVKHLRTGEVKYDIYSSQLANMGIAFGVLGIVTGMIWANYTWGEPWSNDPKQNASAISLLIYLAYFVLRGSIQDEQQRNRISAVFNIFAFFLMIPLLFILPRMSDSLHPGNGGNPGFNAYDLDSNLRKVFYLAVFGWTLLGYWIATIAIRLSITKQKLEDA
ncbi:heme exporter protein C [Ekhidna lutea]|uniref:Heme exporter protein C n=1 Tax=Ekhidna lutea TaxID=447679 RepID=A0A239FE46_EKHLU|nr:cytochrome c biogenesis protein CcsA [Ekhidna lutea]SNS55310.1 heme exporter protein C [Ekhidna lutea]